MKLASLLAAAALLPSLALADTAYTALRTVGAKRGQETLNHVISVQGVNGSPDPDLWKVLLDDPQARAGIRELQISHGQIVSERTPTRGSSVGAAMDFHKLNLDSDSAFTVANKEAAKAQVGFDSADFVLDTTGNGAPVWVLTLRDTGHNTIGMLRISAADGTVVSRNWNGGALASNDQQYVTSSGGDGAAVNDNPPPAREGVPAREGRKVGDKIERFGDKVKRHFLRDGAKLEKFFTGGNSLDEKARQSADDEPQ